MIENIETLHAFETYKTMAKAATSLRISQSAVSKRIATLEAHLNKKLVEKVGRNSVLTSEGVNFLNKVSPLLIELKETIGSHALEDILSLNIGFSESILSSWGARAFAKSNKKFKDIDIHTHALRSPFVIDRVRSGEYLLGVCAGFCSKAPDLVVTEVGQEEFVIIKGKNSSGELIAIDESSETWHSIARQAKKAGIKPTSRLEFFFPIAQLANHGLVDGLVPYGVAKALNIPSSRIEKTGIKRPIIIVARKTTLGRSNIKRYFNVLREHLETELKKLI